MPGDCVPSSSLWRCFLFFWRSLCFGGFDGYCWASAWTVAFGALRLGGSALLSGGGWGRLWLARLAGNWLLQGLVWAPYQMTRVSLSTFQCAFANCGSPSLGEVWRCGLDGEECRQWRPDWARGLLLTLWRRSVSLTSATTSSPGTRFADGFQAWMVVTASWRGRVCYRGRTYPVTDVLYLLYAVAMAGTLGVAAPFSVDEIVILCGVYDITKQWLRLSNPVEKKRYRGDINNNGMQQ